MNEQKKIQSTNNRSTERTVAVQLRQYNPRVGEAREPNGHSQASEKLQQLKDEIISGHREISFLMANAVVRAIKIGNCILEVKKLLPHGSFQKWIDEFLTPNCGISLRTVQRYASLAKNQNVLIEQARRHFGKPDDMSEADAEEMLQTMRINDALKLLALPHPEIRTKSFIPGVTEKNQEVRPLLAPTETMFGRMATEDPSSMNAWMQHPDADPMSTHQLESCLITVNGKGDSNNSAISTALAAYRQGLHPAMVIAVSDRGSARWMAMLDEFPRIHIRGGDGRDEFDIGGVDVVVGLVQRKQFDIFFESFGRLGACFIPHTPPTKRPIALTGDPSNGK